MDEDDFTILIDTDNTELGSIIAYIEASSANSESKAYLELQVNILNQLPYFAESTDLVNVFELTAASDLETGETFVFNLP